MPWWSWLPIVIWWGGMIPQAFIVGLLAKDQARKPPPAKPYTEFQIAVATVAWPVILILLPLVVAFYLGRRSIRRAKQRDAR